MGTYGDVLGSPFAFEDLAFFVEAIFLGIYLYGWDRIPPKQHLMMVLPGERPDLGPRMSSNAGAHAPAATGSAREL